MILPSCETSQLWATSGTRSAEPSFTRTERAVVCASVHWALGVRVCAGSSSAAADSELKRMRRIWLAAICDGSGVARKSLSPATTLPPVGAAMVGISVGVAVGAVAELVDALVGVTPPVGVLLEGVGLAAGPHAMG